MHAAQVFVQQKYIACDDRSAADTFYVPSIVKSP